MNGPHWSRVLRKLYNSNEPEVEYDSPSPGEMEFSDDHYLVRECGITGSEVKSAVEFLQNSNLVRATDEQIQLTERGFQVAHERDLQQRQERQERNHINRQQKTNYAIVLLTVGLVVSRITENFQRTVIGAELPGWLILVSGVAPAVAFLLILAYMYKHGYFTY